MINIAICGASGKMGHFIADVIASREDCKTVCGIDMFGEKYSDFEIVREVSQMPEKPDVIIDFSNPASLDSLIEYCTMNSVALVIGTTKGQLQYWVNSSILRSLNSTTTRK